MKATEIITLAITKLWDASTDYVPHGKERYACHAVVEAVAELGDMPYNSARHDGLAMELKQCVSDYILGHYTVSEYFEKHLKRTGTSDEELQAFRKKMLEEILAVYQRKAPIQAKIDVLNKVKELRASGNNDSPYVCDNILFEIENGDVEAADAVREDIKQYINNNWSVRGWLADLNGKHYENTDEPVVRARMQMIEDLIVRYTAELVAA